MEAMRLLFVIYICAFCGTLASKPKPPDHDCNQIQKFVSEYTSFLNQMPVQTYPVNNFCISNWTVSHYTKAVESFHYAMGNESCAPDFNHNRLNVIQTLYDQMNSIWEAAHCADCVSNQNDTAQFLELYISQLNCTINSTDPCNTCAETYTEMQGFYGNLVQSRKGTVCFDIEDRMNQTRYAWSAKYNCCKGKQHSQKAFIGFASGISSLPVVFYVAMYFLTRRKEARERAAAPPLNDRTAGEEPHEEEPQASSSTTSHSSSAVQQQFDGEDDQCSVGDEPKINNLNVVRGIRESRLIDLNDSGSENLHSDQNVKLAPVKDDVDDVPLIGTDGLLD